MRLRFGFIIVPTVVDMRFRFDPYMFLWLQALIRGG